MDRVYKNKSFVSGMSVNDILNMDEKVFNRLNEKELRQVTGRLVSAGNKRIRNLEKQSNRSPALRAIQRNGGTFSTKGKSFDKVKSEFARAREFLRHETSTVKGWNKVRKETRETLKKENIEFTDNEWDAFWDAYDKLTELNPDAKLESIKYNIFKQISDAIKSPGRTSDEIALSMQGEVTKTYEQQQQLEQERISGGISDFFKWE